jgi:antitoxin Phd
MTINIDNSISVFDAAKNFSKVTRLVDEKGTAVILQNNMPRYILLDFGLLQKNMIADDADVEIAAARLLKKHIKAFEEL